MSNKRARSFVASAVDRLSRTHVRSHGSVSAAKSGIAGSILNNELKHIESPELRRSLSTLIRHAQAPRSRQGRQLSPSRHGRRTQDRRQAADDFPHKPRRRSGGRKIDFARGFDLYRETLTPDRTVLLDRYRLTDVAFKAVGVGSVGTICVVGLFLSGDGEPLFLQVKQAQRSVLERLSERACLSRPAGQARGGGAADDAGRERHLYSAGRRTRLWALEFYVRILKNRRLGAVSELAEQAGAIGIRAAVRPDAGALPRPLRRPRRHRRLHGKERAAFDDALASFAMAYADQTVKDHAVLVKAKGGFAKAETPPEDREAGAQVR